MSKLLILDGNSLAYRAFFALPETLTTPDGQPTNSVYGFMNILLRLLRERKPDFVAVAFDTGVPKSRLALAPEYKGQRDETPAPLASQFPLLRELLETLRVPQIRVPEAEADDILATLAHLAAGDGIDVEIVTGDRDMFPTVRDPQTVVIYTRRGISEVDEMDEAAVTERYGVGPDRYVQLAALRGDNSDNLAGVPGVGDKTAAKLLNAYGDLDGIIAHVDELTPKQSENVAAHWERVIRNREVMTLRRDVELDVGPSDLVIGDWDVDAIRRLYVSLDFGPDVLERTLDAGRPYLADAAVSAAAAVADSEPQLRLRRESDPAGVVAALTQLAVDGPVGVAVRYTGGAVADWAAATNAGDVVLFDAGEAGDALPALDAGGWSTHNAKDLIKAQSVAGVDVGAGLDVDVEIAAFLVDPGAGSYAFDGLCERLLGISATGADVPEGELALGGDADGDATLGRRAWATAMLASRLSMQLSTTDQVDLYRRAERPLIPILAKMERTGIRVDVDYLDELSVSLTERIADLERKIFDHAGREFTVNSPKQLQQVLFEELGLPRQKKTKTGFSTDAATLEALRDEHPIAESLLEYRNLEKLRSTYTDALPPLVDPADGRIHTSFKQTGASTGRISSENPNLMNIPIRSDEGRRIRRAFVADPGWLLVSADYSQIELRVMAHLSGDVALIEAFAAGGDIHNETAARVFGVDAGEVSSLQRSRAKVVNYGLLYGMQTWGLANRMGIPNGEAQAIIDAYFGQFSSLRRFMEDTIAGAHENGYTKTLLGRRRWFPELRSRNPRLRQMGERQALNAPIQGTASDIIKVAMVDLDRELAAGGLRSRLLLQVHDELVVETPTEELATLQALVCDVMAGAVELAVPLVVDVHAGPSWTKD